MMSRSRNRRGSALLIVLGMMAFILVSAVAFSAYMRQARLPSSYLRRTSSSRLLAKAALAQAIDRLDAAIGNNPHPGVGDIAYRYPRLDGDSERRNVFRERVFIGTNQVVSANDTVSTLCLEALAYLPPPVLNAARYYSRRADSARWSDLGFDSGRYAFSAIDVSDLFDVNRLTAGYGRNSSDTGRISLAYLFENANHTGYHSDPSQWDDFLDKNFVTMTDEGAFIFENSKVPLVSVADLNLAINKHKPCGLTSPFCDLVRGSSSDNSFGFGSQDVQTKAGKMYFVADSLLTVTNRTGESFNLEDPRDQPFAGFGADRANKNDVSLNQLVAASSTDFLSYYAGSLSLPAIVQLYDYLDKDSIPTSLALPTVERTPMVTGVSLNGKIDFTAQTGGGTYPSEAQCKPQGAATERYQITTYTLNVDISKLSAVVGSVFPFKYERGAAPSFKVQAAAALTFVPAGSEKALRRGAAKSPAVHLRNDWQQSKQAFSSLAYSGGKPSVVVARSNPVALSLPSLPVETEEEAVLNDVSVVFDSSRVALASALPLPNGIPGGLGIPVDPCTIRTIKKEKWVPDDSMAGGHWEVDGTFKETTEYGALPSNAELSAPVPEGTLASGQTEYVPSIQFWVRIIDKNNETVDLVPASFDDDLVPFTGAAAFFGAAAQRPLLRFSDQQGAVRIKFNKEGFESFGGSKPLADFSPKAYMVDDPRFNYAPENFIAMQSPGGGFKTEWFQKQQSKVGDADGDIFMTTSDAGYLQSIFEFAHILRITDFSSRGAVGCLGGAAYNGEPRESDAFVGGSHPAGKVMWRTYSAYDDNIAGVFKETMSGTRGFRVNPYTPSRDIMMTALANTPLEWWAASTNIVDDASGVKESQLADLNAGAKYTFSEHSGAQVKLRHDELAEVADLLMGAFRGSPQKAWEDVFDDLDWDSRSTTELLGKNLSGVALHSVDKKYLHGFWRECFAVRQQLFLVFVRAEPMMMGGGARGQTPPQLGARAMALVWRDPTPTKADIGGQPRPHSTRVLFYRQFD